MKLKISKRTGIIMVICAVVLAVVMIVVNVLNSQMMEIGPDYFQSDETKLVKSFGMNETSYETGEFAPDATHVVYYYDDNKINDVKIFFEYLDDESAANANNGISMDEKIWASSKKLNGKYIIFNVKGEQYEDLTTEEVRDIIGE